MFKDGTLNWFEMVVETFYSIKIKGFVTCFQSKLKAPKSEYRYQLMRMDGNETL